MSVIGGNGTRKTEAATQPRDGTRSQPSRAGPGGQGGAGLRCGAMRTGSQARPGWPACSVRLHGCCREGGRLGLCQLPLATDLGASALPQSGGDGGRVTNDVEAPGGRAWGAGEPSQQLLGQRGGLDPDPLRALLAETEPRDPRTAPRPGTPAPTLHRPGPPHLPSAPPWKPRTHPPCLPLMHPDPGQGPKGTGPAAAPHSRPPTPTHRSAGLCCVPAAPGLAAEVR